MNNIETFKSLIKKLHAKNHMMGLLAFDSETVAPSASADARGNTMALLSEEIFRLLTDSSTKELLQALNEQIDTVDSITHRQLELLNRELELLNKMPMNEYIEYQTLLNKSQEVWVRAKKTNDFNLFEPYLSKIIDLSRKIALYRNANAKPYDTMLNQFEYGMSMSDLEPFFNNMQKELVPTIKAIAKMPQPDSTLLHKSFHIEKQRELSNRLMKLMGIDRTRCNITESEHPFTIGFNKWDLRITTHYYENQFDSSMYSVIHEGGHATYEMNIDDKYQFSYIANGASLGMHESQSRFYENIIGRSRAFMKLLLPILSDIFPEQMNGIDEDYLYKVLNIVEPMPIRTMADELSYSLHILIRYEIEKLLISNELKVSDAPKYWNKLYKDYLGIDIKNDSEGILQDMHWAGGSIGYFPTYSIGSAYGAQMLHTMQNCFDVEKDISENNMQQIHTWLKDNIHIHGAMYDPKPIIKNACGADFDAQYYFDYLNNKYKALYNL